MTSHGAASFEFAARRKALRQVFAAGWALLACLLVLVHAPVELRAPVVIVFFCFVPGTALVGLLKTDSFGVELSLSVALSVAVSGLTAGILLYASLWSPTAVVVIVTAISLLAGLRDVERGRGPGKWDARRRGLPAAVRQSAELAGQEAGSLSGGIAAVPPLAGGRELLPRRARRSRSERTEEPPVAASPLQRFLLDELRQRSGPATHGGRWRRQPRSIAELKPQELADLLSWSALQRFVMQRTIREVNPELWFVDDLERRLWSRPSDELRGHTPLAPRGVWIAGVSARASLPVAWRVLEDDGKKEWRTRVALEMIDALPQPGLGGAVVAADTGYGSLTGFRRGLAERGLPYLLRVDPITAARELAPEQPSRSAAEARDLLGERIDAQPRPTAVRDEPELVLVEGVEQVLICEVAAAGRDSAFWLSNLPAGTTPERFRWLVRLANRGRVEKLAPDLLHVALKMTAEEGAGLDRELALGALARAEDLHMLDTSNRE